MLCEQKDIFENFHSEFCIQRLMLGIEINLEQQICEEIKEFAGPDSMETVVTLLKDAKEYRVHYEKMNVIVLTKKLSKILNPYPQIKQEYIPKEFPQVLNGM